jgi:hypothetical protein
MKRLLALALPVMLLAVFGDSFLAEGSLLSETRSRRAGAQQLPSFTFAAAGDHGANANTQTSLAALNSSGAAFYLALGDNDYDEIETDEAWCDFIKAGLPTLGPEFPFELVPGNHEEDGGPDGSILNHAACLPDRLGSAGTYPAQYYFDYPAGSPLLRVIAIPAHLTVGSTLYHYTAGSAYYNWLASAIDSARFAGIPWVAVGMHKNCITAGVKPCEIGTDLLNLLVEKKVDLVLQGHDHNYQRSKQLSHGAACTAIAANSFNIGCVADDGADGVYARGAGTIIVISGAFGRCCTTVSQGDSEAGYFATMDNTSNGYTKYTVYGDRIDAQFVNATGAFTDSFTITGTNDADGDGFSAPAEVYLGTSPSDGCGETNAEGMSMSWPPDFVTGGVPNSTNRVTFADLTSFLAPERRLNTNPGNPAYHVRWDLMPGPSVFSSAINVQDLVQLLIVAPPMFGGQRAYNGQTCTG